MSKRSDERVEAGVTAERAGLEEAHALRSANTRTRVVGLRPDSARDFRDREVECQRISALLADSSTRLISVIGQGGMGKTALVCKVLDDLEHGRPPVTVDGRPVDGIAYLSRAHGRDQS